MRHMMEEMTLYQSQESRFIASQRNSAATAERKTAQRSLPSKRLSHSTHYCG